MFLLLFYHLYSTERGTFYTVVIIAITAFLVELLYFERNVPKEVIPYVVVNEHAD